MTTKDILRFIGLISIILPIAVYFGLTIPKVQPIQSILPEAVKPITSFRSIRIHYIPPEEQNQQVASQSAQLPPIVTGEKTYKIPILLYHYVSVNGKQEDTIRTSLSTPPGVFEQQLILLSQQGFTTITFDELAAAFDEKFTLPKNPVILTFDDGYADFYYNVAPLLQKYRMKGVVFIPTGLMGGGNYMTWRQIEELAKSPFIAFGAHSVHHYALQTIDQNVMVHEIEESKRVLESHIGYRVNWFCYPYGYFTDAVITEAKKAGFIGGITTIPGVWQYRSRLFYIPRLRAGTRTGEDFLGLVQ